MTRRLPDPRVHKDGGVQPCDIVVQVRHALPPVSLDVILQLDAILTIVIDSTETVVDLGGGEDKAILLAVTDDCLEERLVSYRHIIWKINWFAYEDDPLSRLRKGNQNVRTIP